MELREAAQAMLDQLETRKRPNDEDFISLKDGRPDWMQEVAYKGHHGMIDFMPDDERYRFIQDALYILAEADDLDDADQGIEADIYTSDLTGWLASHNGRLAYVEDYVNEFAGERLDGKFDMTALLQGGQWMERREVFGLVAEALGEHCAVAA